jgi:hypothetical protein
VTHPLNNSIASNGFAPQNYEGTEAARGDHNTRAQLSERALRLENRNHSRLEEVEQHMLQEQEPAFEELSRNLSESGSTERYATHGPFYTLAKSDSIMQVVRIQTALSLLSSHRQ